MVSLSNFNPERVPSTKMAVHGLQILLVFVAWCLEISVFRDKKARINGNNGWVFGVCFLSIPAWVYLLMTPRWDRTRHLADPRAMLTVDVLFTFIWLSAFASQAAYNTAGQCGNSCGQSKAIVGIGVVVTLLWAAAITVSFFTLHHWNLDGYLPGYDQRKLPGANIDPDKAAFSMEPHDDEAYAPVNMDDRDNHNDEYASGAYGGSAYAGASISAAGGRSDPYDADEHGRYGTASPSNAGGRYGAPSPLHGDGRYGSVSPSNAGARPAPLFDNDTAYNPQGPTGGYIPPSAREEFQDNGPVTFPAGNYDRVH